jgi:hypothetical protein
MLGEHLVSANKVRQSMHIIDGSFGEGGGQILRTSLAHKLRKQYQQITRQDERFDLLCRLD